MGKTRDLDGSVDRVADPPPKLWPVLAAFQHKCLVENINLETIFEEGGGNHFGVMKTSNFFSTLKDNFQRYEIKEEIIQDLLAHYGVGYKDPRGRFEKVGWMDFCEDVRRSEAEDLKYGVKGVAEALAMTRGAVISYDSLADKDDLISDELQNLAADEEAYDGFWKLTSKTELTKKMKAEAEWAKAHGIDLKMVQGDGGLHEKARVTLHADDHGEEYSFTGQGANAAGH